jgi:hypothetical protein
MLPAKFYSKLFLKALLKNIYFSTRGNLCSFSAPPQAYHEAYGEAQQRRLRAAAQLTRKIVTFFLQKRKRK